MTERLRDKVAIVFGAGSSGPGWGNGKAAAVLFAREGARVMAVDANPQAADETRKIIESEGGRCEVAVADVTKADDVERVVALTAGTFGGRIDILHNNVGSTVMGALHELTPEQWDRAYDINARGAFLACKYVLPIMVDQRAGSIINISSLASIQVNDYPYPAYSSSKAALNQLTRSIAVNYAQFGIRANAILPGVMDTPLVYKELSGQFSDREELVRKRNAASPMRRMGTAWDVAHASVFLASDEAGYITGVLLPVDGGKSCAGR